MGAPHVGPDSRQNIIVVCPNHHVQFDKAAIAIHPESGIVVHRAVPGYLEEPRLFVMREHELGREFVQYHYQLFLERKV